MVFDAKAVGNLFAQMEWGSNPLLNFLSDLKAVEPSANHGHINHARIDMDLAVQCLKIWPNYPDTTTMQVRSVSPEQVLRLHIRGGLMPDGGSFQDYASISVPATIEEFSKHFIAVETQSLSRDPTQGTPVGQLHVVKKCFDILREELQKIGVEVPPNTEVRDRVMAMRDKSANASITRYRFAGRSWDDILYGDQGGSGPGKGWTVE